MAKAKPAPQPQVAPVAVTSPAIPTVTRRLADLKSHPRNYQQHPRDQIEHIKRSLLEHGLYRPVIIARGDVVLAGHGLTIAAREIGMTEIACYQRDIDPNSPEALRLLAGDNEIGRAAERDDRLLTELLADVKAESEGALLGTGLDERQLAALVYVTRTADEVRTTDEAAEWVGLPGFEGSPEAVRLTVVFRTKADRDEWVRRQNEAGFAMKIHYKAEAAWSTWWPPKERDDLASVRFEPTPEKSEALDAKA